MRQALTATLATVLIFSATVVAKAEIKDSIVHIYTTANPPDYAQPWRMQGQTSCRGSGAIIAGGRVLTNAHVVADHTFIQVRRAGQAKKYVAEVEAIAHAQDLALLRVSDDAFFAGTKPLPIGALPRPGDAVVTYGFPEGGTRLSVTEGVVSRVDHMDYTHTLIPHLVCQIDAALNGGSSGGPVVSKGKIVGLAFQSEEDGENMGYMIPTPVISHFLSDLEDGRYDGVPDLPFSYQDMENPQIRSYYGLSGEQSGVLVTEVPAPIRGDHMLLPRDVLLEIDGFDVANDGTIEFRKGERVAFDFAIDRKQIGEPISLKLWRDGQEMVVDVLLELSKTASSYLVPRYLYDVAPSYYIVGGLVFSPITFNYIEAQVSELPLELYAYFVNREVTTGEAKEIVLLTNVLSDEINRGYDVYTNTVVWEVNGKRITSMQDLVGAFAGNLGEDFHRIVLGNPGTAPCEILLSTKLVTERHEAILKTYQVSSDRSADLTEAFSRAAR